MTILSVVLLLVAAWLLWQLLRERAMRKHRTLLGRWPIPPVPLDAIDDVFRPGPFGPGLETEVVFVGRGELPVAGGTTDSEAWILAVLARRARLMFELGTCTGKTTYLWARNSPPDARVVTLTLPPAGRAAFRPSPGDSPADDEAALVESAFTEFLYTGTDVASKVTQLFGDSKALDVSPWAGRCDLVFVDGSHAYSYVKSDSAKALALVRPGGLVLWHDYAGPLGSPGVYRALNELAREIPLVRIAGTMLVVYRKPESGAAT